MGSIVYTGTSTGDHSVNNHTLSYKGSSTKSSPGDDEAKKMGQEDSRKFWKGIRFGSASEEAENLEGRSRAGEGNTSQN